MPAVQHETASLIDALASTAHWLAVAATLVLVIGCVAIHYEGLRFASRYVLEHPGRQRLILVILVLLAAHVAEIWLFALGYMLLLTVEGTGALVGLPIHGILDHVYFSAVTYTTLGFGDLTPQGPVRILVGTESITGLALVTWSASITFLAMQKRW